MNVSKMNYEINESGTTESGVNVFSEYNSDVSAETIKVVDDHSGGDTREVVLTFGAYRGVAVCVAMLPGSPAHSVNIVYVDDDSVLHLSRTSVGTKKGTAYITGLLSPDVYMEISPLKLATRTTQQVLEFIRMTNIDKS